MLRRPPTSTLFLHDALPISRSPGLFLQDLAEPQNITQWIAQIMARFADPSAQKLPGSSARRLGAGNQPGLHRRQDLGRRSVSHSLGVSKRLVHFLRGLVTLFRVVSACFEENIVELRETRFDFTGV